MSKFKKEELQNLSNLLLSSDDSNAAVAFEIIGANQVGMELASELFAIFKMSSNREHQNKAAQLLKALKSEELLEAMNRKSYLDGYSSRNKIKSYCEGTPLEPMKLALALYYKFGKGVQYLISELDSDALTTLLKSFMQGKNEFVLERQQITKIPKELFAFPELEKLVLTDNQIKTLPQSITKFPKLKELHLSQNKIKKIPKGISKLKDLELFDISKNDLQELPDFIADCTNLKHLNLSGSRFGTFPAVIFDIPNLETLNLSWITGGSSMNMPDGMSKLKKLTKLTLTDAVSVVFFKNFPRFTTIVGTTKEPINTENVALAKQAYEQNKEAIEYLFEHADLPYITTMLDELITDGKLVFDMLVILKALPEKVKDYNVRELYFDCRYSKLDTGFWESLEYLPNLEVLRLGQDVGPQSSWDNPMSEALCKLSKLRILDTFDYGFTKIPDAIGQLTKLEELVLSLNNNDVLIPENIKHLTKLKKLHIKVKMMPHMADGQEAATLLARANQCKALLPNCEVICTR